MEECKKSMPTYEESINELRKAIKDLAAQVDASKKHLSGCETMEGENRGEELANLTLCYRHLEDASMRLGKVLQHRNGGVSVYDKNVVGSPKE